MHSAAAAPAVRRCGTGPGEHFANSVAYAGNLHAETAAGRSRPKWAATGRSPAYRTDGVPVDPGARVPAPPALQPPSPPGFLASWEGTAPSRVGG